MPENMFEMKSFDKSSTEENWELEKLPQESRPNILKLLGLPPPPHANLTLPRYSILYISPLSPFSLVYNLLYFLVFYFTQIHLPLIIAFGQSFTLSQFSNYSLSIAYWAVFGFMIVDMGLNAHKGFYEQGKGKVCQDRELILRYYLRTQVYYDLIAVGIMLVPKFSQNPNVDLLLFIPIILLWIKKFKYQDQIITILQYKQSTRWIFTLGTLFLDVLLQGHYGACIFAKIDLTLWAQQYYGSNTAYYWLSNNNNYSPSLMNAPWYNQYIYAQSFSSGTLSTLAPGPFVKNVIQVSFALGVMIYFMLFASYIMEILVNILYSEESKRVFHEQNIQNFDKYLMLKGINQNLKTRIYNFFELIWSVDTRLQTEEQKTVISLLPMTLKQELLVEISFISKFFMLKCVSQPKALEKQLALRITKVIMDGDSCLFKQGSLLRKRQEQTTLELNYVYYLARGMVKYYMCMHNKAKEQKSHKETWMQFVKSDTEHNFPETEHNEFILSLSNSDKFIGLYEFVTKRSFSYCCKAIDLCEVDRITRKDFMEVLKITKNDEIFIKIRHQILVQRNFTLINKVCSVCFQSHLEENCPVINIKERITINLFLKQGNYGRRQQRKINWKRIRNEQRNNRRIRSNKVILKEKPEIVHHRQQEEAISVFSKVLQNTNIRLEDLLFQVTKIDEIEMSEIWQKFYPEENADRLNYWIPVRRRT